MKKKVFVGSSRESLNIAGAIQEELENSSDIIVTLWSQGVFDLSSSTIDDLLQVLDDVNYGIFVFSPDDITKIRNQELMSVRDNVIFEMGLFIGRLGKKSTFFCIPKDTKDFRIPSDLIGVTPATYDHNRLADNPRAALGPACNQMRRAITNPRQSSHRENELTLQRNEVFRLIENLFRLFKQCIAACSDNELKIRLHLLKLDPETQLLSMLVQDDVYQDRNFEISLSDGLTKQVVVCEAINRNGLAIRNLSEGHTSYYPDSSIPYFINSVMAFPVRNKRGKTLGAISLDSEEKLEDMCIKEKHLSSLFIKLGTVIEQILHDKENNIGEL